MTERIFRLDGTNRLTEMSRAPFASEDLFQSILADHPAILSVSGGVTPLLIRREQPVVDSADGGGRWSLDHLYVDTNGVPILVEVKRATDTRARREVVAQMLDYAANGIAYWSLSEMISAFAATCTVRGQNADEVLRSFISSDTEPEDFWKAVEANLRAGRVRLLFVADDIPRELRRIVEFLNEQMRPAEVLAVQVEHYEAADGTRTLVPKVIGATERATAAKSVGEPLGLKTIDDWVARLESVHGEAAARGAQRAADWFRTKGCEVTPTVSGDAIAVKVPGDDGRPAWPFFIRHSSGGRVELALGYLKNRTAFASDDSRKAALERLRSLTGISLRSTDSLTGYPSFPASNLLSEDAWTGFAEFAASVVDQAKRAGGA